MKKITKKMLDYWYGILVLPEEVRTDLVDIANGDYKPELLKSDILVTWGERGK